jgi:hypothetical protein
VKRLLALLAGGLGLRAVLRRRKEPALGSSPAAGLRAKLDEARAVSPEPEPVAEEAPPEPAPASEVDAAPGQDVPPGQDEDARRADVHARARHAIEELGEPKEG